MSIKWTGSKKWLTKVLRSMDEVYEPFAGSATVSMRRSTTCHLNDTCKPLIEMYRQLQAGRTTFVVQVQREVNKIKSAHDPKAEYYSLRDRFNRGGMTDPVLFCVILYLGFNGLYRVGPNGCNTPYGGDSRKFNSQGLLDCPVDKIKTLTSLPWDQAAEPNDTCVIYADPPYATAFTGYNARGWTHADNVSLFTSLAEKPNPVLISCLRTDDNEKLLRELDFDFLSMDKTFSNGAKSVKKGEILAFNEKAIPYIVFNKVKR